VDPCRAKSHGYEDEKKNAYVGDEVMCEEVGVDEDCQQRRYLLVGIARVAHVDDASGARKVTADGCIHESGEKRYVADVKEAAFGIGPGTDVGFEELHQGADDVEDEDDAGFADGFHAED